MQTCMRLESEPGDIYMSLQQERGVEPPRVHTGEEMLRHHIPLASEYGT